MADETMGLRCRNCGNTGMDMFGMPCVCPAAVAQQQAAQDIQPTMADETMGELRQALDDAMLTHTGRSIGDLASQRVLDDIMPYIAALRPAQADEPRASMEPPVENGFLVLVAHELKRARAKHGPMHSHHEAYAVLLEELDEVWQEVKSQQPNTQRIIAELIQVAAMCNRWAEDVCGALPPTDERGR